MEVECVNDISKDLALGMAKLELQQMMQTKPYKMWQCSLQHFENCKAPTIGNGVQNGQDAGISPFDEHNIQLKTTPSASKCQQIFRDYTS